MLNWTNPMMQLEETEAKTGQAKHDKQQINKTWQPKTGLQILINYLYSHTDILKTI